MHILWIAPASALIGFIVCGLWASAGPIKSNETDISRLQKNLFEAESKLARMCDDCSVANELDAKMHDLKAVLEEKKSLKNSNVQLRGIIMRMSASGRLAK
jgi:hypothetical protein